MGAFDWKFFNGNKNENANRTIIVVSENKI